MAKAKKPRIEDLIPEPEEVIEPEPESPMISEDGVDLSKPNPKKDLKIGSGVRKVRKE